VEEYGVWHYWRSADAVVATAVAAAVRRNENVNVGSSAGADTAAAAVVGHGEVMMPEQQATSSAAVHRVETVALAEDIDAHTPAVVDQSEK